MNVWNGLGRITRDAEIKTVGETSVARFSLAVDRRFKKDGEPTADFLNCVAWGKTASFIEKYCKKGTKLAVTAHIESGSYTNKDGNKVYTFDLVCDQVEFAESKSANAQPSESKDFMEVAESIDDEIPFR